MSDPTLRDYMSCVTLKLSQGDWITTMFCLQHRLLSSINLHCPLVQYLTGELTLTLDSLTPFHGAYKRTFPYSTSVSFKICFGTTQLRSGTGTFMALCTTICRFAAGSDLICVSWSQSNNYTFSDVIRIQKLRLYCHDSVAKSCQISSNSLMNMHEQYGHGKARFENLH